MSDDAIVLAADSLAGLSYGNPTTRDLLVHQLYPGDTTAAGLSMGRAQSSCGLVCRAVLRIAEVDGRITFRGKERDVLRCAYADILGAAIELLVALGQARGLWLPATTPLKAGDMVLVGGTAGGGVEHVLTLTSDPDASGSFATVEGGQTDAQNGNQPTAVLAKRRQVYQRGKAPWLRDAGTSSMGRGIVGVLRAGSLPTLPSASPPAPADDDPPASTEPPPAAAAGPAGTEALVRGVDVSSYQGGSVDWPRVKAAGYAFAMFRAYEGKDLDPTWERNRERALGAGLLVTSYQLLRARHPGDWQAQKLLAALGPRRPGELPPVVDLELLDGQPADRVRDVLLAWLATVRAALGVAPIVYTGPAFWTTELHGQELDLGGSPLWVADYRARAQPEVPLPWRVWTLWQYTNEARVAGVPTPCDASVFRGDLDALRAFAA